MTNELLPCPFCGYEKPEPALSEDATCAVFCAGCGTLGPDPSETRNPADMWNHRSPAPGAVAMREAARLQDLIDRACNALTDSICVSGNDAATNLHWVGKLRRDAIPPSALPAPEVPECHGCKHWTLDPFARDFEKQNQYGQCRGMRSCGVEIETTGDCSVDAIGTDATFCCKGWEAR